jgi:hypothetical protein
MRASRPLLVTLLLATAVAVPAFAQTGAPPLTNYPACTSTPTKQDSDQAHSAFLLGKRFFDEADYGSAIHNFADAYKLDCTKTELLTIVARAYELNGNRPEAVHALETYLQRAQTIGADDKAQIQKRIDNLKAQIAAQASSTATATATATAVPTQATATAPPPPPPPPPPPESGGHTVLPWIVTGVGAAAAITGGIIYLVESSAANAAKNKCVGENISACTPKPGVTETAKEIGNDYTPANNLVPVGSILFFAGLGVAAGGLLWHFLEPTGPAAEKKAALTPTVGPGYAGLSLGGSF